MSHTQEAKAKIAASLALYHGTEEERFLSHVRKTLGCWWWEGTVHKKYGRMGNRSAHRLAYELYVGPLIPGHHIHHTCHNNLCVRPDHLEQVSPEEHWFRHSPAGRRERYLRKLVKAS
jgi:hypothetical protein